MLVNDPFSKTKSTNLVISCTLRTLYLRILVPKQLLKIKHLHQKDTPLRPKAP
jgi:hypothetical protein